MRAARLIAGKDLRLLLRQRTIWVLGLLAPLGLSAVLSVVFGGGAADGEVTFAVGLVDEDGGDVSAAFTQVVSDLEEAGLLEVTVYDEGAAARAAVDDGDIAAAWVVPAGFTDAVRAGERARLTVVGDVDAGIARSVAEAIASRFAVQVGAGRLAVTAALDRDLAGPDELAALGEEVSRAPATIRAVPAAVGDRLLDPTTSIVAGIALFFSFFTAGLPMLSLLEERSAGTLVRLLVAPIRQGSVLAGKVATGLVLGVLSLGALVVASSVLLGADWGPLPGALVVCSAGVIAVAGVMSIAASLARSIEQAGNLQSIVAVVLGVLGGTFVPIAGSESGLLRTLQRCTPNGWFLEGLEQARANGLGAALPAVAVLLGIGLVTGAIGLILANRRLRW